MNENPIKWIFLSVYIDLKKKKNYNDVSYLKEREIVTLRNNTMTKINDFMLSMMPWESRTYLSIDLVSYLTENVENLGILYPMEFLNQLELADLLHDKLSLKVGMLEMLFGNLNQSCGLWNGTLLVVIQLSDRIMQARILTDINSAEKVYLPRIITELSQNKYPFIMRMQQFLLRICYAMTTNKN